MPSLVVQSDFTILLERKAEDYTVCRDLLLRFAELEKCPDYFHTYKLTRLSLWNAIALGLTAEQIIQDLKANSKYPIPSSVISMIHDNCGLYGKLKMRKEDGRLFLYILDHDLIDPVLYSDKMHKLFEKYEFTPELETLRLSELSQAQKDLLPSKSEQTELHRFALADDFRGRIKLALIDLGLPVDDQAGYREGSPLKLSFKPQVKLRDYQADAAHAFYLNGDARGGSGVLALPCGAGKTIIGLEAMIQVARHTLIITPNGTSLQQWKREILEKTTLSEAEVGEYSSAKKDIRPVTISTYQMLTANKGKKQNSGTDHLLALSREDWGFVICDEVHLLPAPLFQLVANIQSCRRLGLTATLVREDNLERHVFGLIGPKKYDIPWRALEEKNWIAKASCTEVRVPFTKRELEAYNQSDRREQFKIASLNSNKLEVLGDLLERHNSEQVLVLGLYLEQLADVAKRFSLPIVDGSVPQKEREKLYNEFRHGRIRALGVSKIGNNALDLPDASVAIQISGMFGSRQEEAQRLGRILRPKEKDNRAHFYSIITEHSSEDEFAMKRQLFLVEQGYEYNILASEQVNV